MWWILSVNRSCPIAFRGDDSSFNFVPDDQPGSDRLATDSSGTLMKMASASSNFAPISTLECLQQQFLPINIHRHQNHPQSCGGVGCLVAEHRNPEKEAWLFPESLKNRLFRWLDGANACDSTSYIHDDRKTSRVHLGRDLSVQSVLVCYSLLQGQIR